MKRYLAVYAPLGWQIIDTQNNNAVVAEGSRTEMIIKCETMNSEVVDAA